MSTTEIILTIVSTVFGSVGFWTFIQSILMKKKSDKSNEKKMIMGLAYINIVRRCEYWLEQGWVDYDELRDLQHYLYEPYRNNGGNGTAEMIFKKASALPNKPQKED